MHALPHHLEVIQPFRLVFPSQAHSLVPSNLAHFPLRLASPSSQGPCFGDRSAPPPSSPSHLVSCQCTPRLSPERVSRLLPPVIPASVTLVQAFISFCWDWCSRLPTDFLSLSLALFSLFSILLLLTPCPISPALSATVSLYESLMLRRVLYEYIVYALHFFEGMAFIRLSATSCLLY